MKYAHMCVYIVYRGFGEAKRLAQQEVEAKEAQEAAIVAATAARQEELRREEAMRFEAQNSQSFEAAQLQHQEAERLKKAKKAAAKEAKMMILSFKNADHIHINITYDHFVGTFPGAQPLFSHLRRKKRRMLALDSDESGSEAPWLGSLC